MKSGCGCRKSDRTSCNIGFAAAGSGIEKTSGFFIVTPRPRVADIGPGMLCAAGRFSAGRGSGEDRRSVGRAQYRARSDRTHSHRSAGPRLSWDGRLFRAQCLQLPPLPPAWRSATVPPRVTGLVGFPALLLTGLPLRWRLPPQPKVPLHDKLLLCPPFLFTAHT